MKAAANTNGVQPAVKHRYEMTIMQVDDFEHMSYTTYGIRIVDEGGDELLSYPDIATSKEKVRHFIDMLEKNDVALIHVNDVIEDFLA